MKVKRGAQKAVKPKPPPTVVPKGRVQITPDGLKVRLFFIFKTKVARAIFLLKALKLIAEFEEARRRADSEPAVVEESDVTTVNMGHEEWKQACMRRAVISNNKRTSGSTLSGIKKWVSFNRDVLGDGNCAFPITEQALLLWSCTFKTPGCFTNYLGYVKAVCHLRL